MLTGLALLAAIMGVQAAPGPADDVAALKTRIEALEKENTALRSEVDRLKKEKTDAGLREQLLSLEKQALADAQTILRLKNALKVLEQKPAAGPVAPTERKGTGPEGPSPLESIQARIEVVDAKMGFAVIAKGRGDGVLLGYRFDIFREIHKGGSSERQSLAVGEVEKYLDSGETLSKLKIIEGNAARIRPGDRAVALRKHPPLKKPPEVEPEPPQTRLGIYKITGLAGTEANDGFIVNYGSDDGAHQTDTLWVYKDSRLKAKLRLDVVQNRFSVANIISGTRVQSPEIGDHVFTKELKKAVVGRVRINDGNRGILIDVGELNHGVRAGDLFEVRRQGRKVGVIQVTTPDRYHAYAKPFADTKAEDIRLGDHVERIDTK